MEFLNKTDTSLRNNETGSWVGIDFGTSNCASAVWDSLKGRAKWMRFNIAVTETSGKPGRVIPSAVFWNDESLSEPVVGRAAMESSQEANGGTLITSIKRMLGKQRLQDLDEELLDSLPFDVVEEEGQLWVQLFHGKKMKPVDLVTVLLKAIRHGAHEYCVKQVPKKQLEIPGFDGNPPRHVVLGVPAQFSQRQRQLLQEAGRQAGFDGHVTTMTESTAAAMAYGLFVAPSDVTRSILVFDMGGGTTDVTICEMKPRQQEPPGDGKQDSNDLIGNEVDLDCQFSVLVTHGDSQLGGDDMDRALLERVLDNTKNGNDKCWSKPALLRSCRQAKEELSSSNDSASILLPDGNKIAVRQTEFEASITPLIRRAEEVVNHALERYVSMPKSSKSTIDEVVLVGGATRVPAVRKMLQGVFPKVDLCHSVHPMSAVAQGLAIAAAARSNLVPKHELRSALMLDTLPHAIGVIVGDQHFVEILSKDASLPAMGHGRFTLANPRQPGVTIFAGENVGEGLPLERVGEFNFLLHRLSEAELRRLGNRSILVGMTMESSGKLIVSIFDENDPEHLQKKKRYLKDQGKEVVDGSLDFRGEIEEGFTKEQLLLLISCAVVFVIYVIIKVTFNPALEECAAESMYEEE